MVRHGDPGVPAWLIDSEEPNLLDRDRTISFETSVTETQMVTYNVSHTVTVGNLIDDGYLNEDDDHDQDTVRDAISEYIADGMVDQYEDDDPYYGDSEYYDSDWNITEWGN